jgi:hypothetical protein
MLPTPIGRNRESSTFPYMLMVMEPSSEFVIGCDLFDVEKQPYKTLPPAVVDSLLRMFDRHAICPSGFNLASPVTATLLHNTATALGIRCHVTEHLPVLDHAINVMLSRMIR